MEFDDDTFFTQPADAAGFAGGATVTDEPIGVNGGDYGDLTGGAIDANGGTQPAFDDGSAFLGGWSAAPDATAAAPAPAEPEEEDPRILWQRKHADELKARDAEENAAKQAAANKAREHIIKFYESRKTAIASRHKNNRTDAEPEVEVPAGSSPWEKVTSLVNLGATSDKHATDITRYKQTLLACKTRNVAIRG